MNMETKLFNGREVTIYPAAVPEAPIIYCIMYQNVGSQILEAARQAGLPPFHLVMLSQLHWDQDLSPWPHSWIVDPNDDFTGQAPEFLALIQQEIVPYVKSQLPEAGPAYISGYSMGGLFSLWTLCQTDYFKKAASVSGSVWYPDFVTYVETQGCQGHPQAIYLSVGSAESKARNKVLQTTQTRFEALEAYYQSQNIECTFQVNPGNHFVHVIERTVAGLDWILTH